jgi:hypothetical protein
MHDDDAGDIPLPTPPGGNPNAVLKGSKLEDMDVGDLLALRDAIDKLLPARKLSEMRLDEELILQFMRVRELQKKTLEDTRISAQQKAAVVNSVAATLAQLTKMQTELHTAERFKAIENLMIKTIKRLPIEVANDFIAEYERLAE